MLYQRQIYSASNTKLRSEYEYLVESETRKNDLAGLCPGIHPLCV
jgi:hypothetical protein